MTSTGEFGDVYVCLFPFTSGRGSKPRPVLVLKDLAPDCLICRITSVPHQGFLDLQVQHWQHAGLERPSTIRLSRLVTVEKALLKLHIGRLSHDDLSVVRQAWNEQFRL
jgi:mRNA interferase MazF